MLLREQMNGRIRRRAEKAQSPEQLPKAICEELLRAGYNRNAISLQQFKQLLAGAIKDWHRLHVSSYVLPIESHRLPAVAESRYCAE